MFFLMNCKEKGEENKQKNTFEKSVFLLHNFLKNFSEFFNFFFNFIQITISVQKNSKKIEQILIINIM